MNQPKQLHLNRDRKMICGVCAGIADYIEIEPFIVRIVCVIAAITWPLTIAAYFITYFCLNHKDNSIGELRDNLTGSKPYRHFSKVDYRKRLYKDRENRKIRGVCAGIANYLEINPFFVRMAFLLSLFLGPFAILGYIVAAIVMENDPNYEQYRAGRRTQRHQTRTRSRDKFAKYSDDVRPEEQDEGYSQDFGRNHNDAFKPRVDKRDLQDADRSFTALEEKLQKLEATITSKKFKLHNEFKRMST